MRPLSSILDVVNALAYLDRIGLGDAPPVNLDGLRALQRAHLERVPFENASVLRGEPIVLDTALLVDKVAARGRGGFCFELNGAFAWLLTTLGFEVALLPGRFWSDRGLGPPNEHLALRVTLDGEPWLVDVGAGYSFREPRHLAVGREQEDPSGRFRLVPGRDAPASLDVEWLHRDGTWRPHYRFEERAVSLDAFVEVCEFLASSPESPFTRGWMCARALPDGGWATLDGPHLVVTGGDGRIDETLRGDALDDALLRWFDVPRIPGPASR